MEVTKRLATDTINKFLYNTNEYISNSLEEQAEKDKELDLLVIPDLIQSIAEVRPYTNIVTGMRIVDYNINYNRLDNYKVDADVELTSRSALTTNTTSSTNVVKIKVVLEPINESLLITEYSKDVVNISEEDTYDEDMAEGIPMVISFTNSLLEDKPNLTNLYYAYRGRPSTDPLDYINDNPVGVDMYTILYWMMKHQEIPNDFNYPLTSEDFISYDGIYEVYSKGHKYKYYLDEMEKGDFVFFDDNDTTVGIYIGDNRCITITGKQPYDRSGGLDFIVLEDEWWDRFNGRIMRFKEEDVVRWELM